MISHSKAVSRGNIVIVRIWTSGWNINHRGESCGHVSIEIPSLSTGEPGSGYFSLWPKQDFVRPQACVAPNPGGRGLIYPKQGMLLTGYKRREQVTPRDPRYSDDGHYDFDFEGRPPEVTICFYGLNVSQISERFRIERESLQGWVLLGNNCLLNQGAGHSCSSLAYVLLKAGGIYNLISGAHSSKFSSVVSPDGLSQALIRAKREELRLCSSTGTWHYPEESDVQAERTCLIL